jgi:succinate dehydrogenase/fumarate reductase iron-sulfur protein
MLKATFKIHRYDPEIQEQSFSEYAIPYGENTTVLDSLFYIQEEIDPSLSFRCSCRNWMCGSCGLVANGRGRLACKTRVADLGEEVEIQPMRNLPVLKDLIVDLEPFLHKYRSVTPNYIRKEGLTEPEKVTKPERELIDDMLECITCGLCHSACDAVAMRPDYLGPAALTRAYNLIADKRDGAREERFDSVMNDQGIFGCHSFGACVEVCPKGIKPMVAIQKLKEKTLRRSLGMRW